MISLEQVKLLESKVSKTIDFVKKVTGENSVLKQKLDSHQTRIDELEVLIRNFKEEQNRIEDGILAALDRLNQFEDALENKLQTENGRSPGGDGETRTEAEAGVSGKKQGAPDKNTEQETPDTLPGDDENSSEPALGELDIF